MNDGSLYGTYRTIAGWACHGYSRDDGHTWDTDWMTYSPGGRRVKNPRSANFVRRFSNGKYWVTETQKTVARIHEIPADLLEGQPGLPIREP